MVYARSQQIAERSLNEGHGFSRAESACALDGFTGCGKTPNEGRRDRKSGDSKPSLKLHKSFLGHSGAIRFLNFLQN
jgi:hypothetical protein